MLYNPTPKPSCSLCHIFQPNKSSPPDLIFPCLMCNHQVEAFGHGFSKGICHNCHLNYQCADYCLAHNHITINNINYTVIFVNSSNSSYFKLIQDNLMFSYSYPIFFFDYLPKSPNLSSLINKLLNLKAFQ